jgi:MFS family permease
MSGQIGPPNDGIDDVRDRHSLGSRKSKYAAFLQGTAAAAGMALVTSIGNLGGFVGLLVMGRLKDVTGSFTAGLFGLAGMLALAALSALLTKRGEAAYVTHISSVFPRRVILRSRWPYDPPCDEPPGGSFGGSCGDSFGALRVVDAGRSNFRPMCPSPS